MKGSRVRKAGRTAGMVQAVVMEGIGVAVLFAIVLAIRSGPADDSPVAPITDHPGRAKLDNQALEQGWENFRVRFSSPDRWPRWSGAAR